MSRPKYPLYDEEEDYQDDRKPPRKKNWLLILMLMLFVLAAGIATGIFFSYWNSGNLSLSGGRTDTDTAATTAPDASDATADTHTQQTLTSQTAPLADNPVDFAALLAETGNTDIYAWLYVPNTNIDYPVACSMGEDDLFYLEHNIYKDYEFAGTIYSEKKNKRDFSDRNTVLYGHNMLNGTMFRTLHQFEDPDFFAENSVFYIYTPGHILTYTIFSAYEYDNRHLLNSFDYTDDAVWADYLAYAVDPKSMVVNTRPDVHVTTADKIVTLSTCVGYNSEARYLVQGVLTDDQPTK